MTIVITEGAPIHDQYDGEHIIQAKTYPIHNFARKLHKLLSLIQFTLMYSLGMV